MCGYKEAATAIPATNAHKYVTKIDKAANCEAAGSKHEECSVCGAKKAAASIPATGAHKFGAYKTTVSATVMKTGTKERTCSVCGKKETLVIPKLKATIKVAIFFTITVILAVFPLFNVTVTVVFPAFFPVIFPFLSRCV